MGKLFKNSSRCVTGTEEKIQVVNFSVIAGVQNATTLCFDLSLDD